jgi:hypothetical protein
MYQYHSRIRLALAAVTLTTLALPQLSVAQSAAAYPQEPVKLSCPTQQAV